MALDLSRYAPTFSVMIGGKPQPELKNAVISLEIDENLDAPSMFTLNVHEGLDMKTQMFTWLDNKLLDPASGEDVDIYLGYAGQTKMPEEPMVSGRIVALNPSFPSSGVPSLSVQGYDHSYLLKKYMAKNRSYNEVKNYGDIVKAVAKEPHNLGIGKIDSNITLREKVIPNPNDTDYSFLESLANRLGYEFFVRNRKIYFRMPRYCAEEIASLKWGKDIISFSPRMSTAKAVSKVTVKGHNLADPSKPIIGSASLEDLQCKEPKSKTAMQLAEESLKKGFEIFEQAQQEKKYTEAERFEHNIPVSNPKDAKDIAKALLFKANNSLIEGTCECIGFPEIRAGTNVKIDGIGKRFSGKYYVKSAKHSIGDGGYRLTLEVRRGSVGVV